jgi:hypothetical protein
MQSSAASYLLLLLPYGLPPTGSAAETLFAPNLLIGCDESALEFHASTVIPDFGGGFVQRGRIRMTKA